MSNAKPTNIMDDLIAHMKLCGWVVEEDGSLTHPDCMTFPAHGNSESERWVAAIKSCIEVATGA